MTVNTLCSDTKLNYFSLCEEDRDKNPRKKSNLKSYFEREYFEYYISMKTFLDF